MSSKCVILIQEESSIFNFVVRFRNHLHHDLPQGGTFIACMVDFHALDTDYFNFKGAIVIFFLLVNM